jgi:hypothetical protein
MKGTYEVQFCDGSREHVTAETADAAKGQAKNARIRDVDPGGSMPPADRAAHPRVKVASVTEIEGDRRFRE